MEYTVALTSEDLHMLSQLQDLLPPFRCSFEMCPCFPVLFLLFVTLLAQNMKHQQDADANEKKVGGKQGDKLTYSGL